MNSEASTLAQRIRICAELAGNGDALSRKTAIPRRTLESYLTGETEPKASRLVDIARAAGVSVAWLAAGEGPMMANEAAELRPVPPAPVPGRAATDGRLLGRLYEAIQRVHREAGSHLPMAALAEIAAAKHDQIVAAEDDPEERLRMVKLIEVMIREELRAAAAAPDAGKQRA